MLTRITVLGVMVFLMSCTKRSFHHGGSLPPVKSQESEEVESDDFVFGTEENENRATSSKKSAESAAEEELIVDDVYVPDLVLEGTEAFNSCDQCIGRAKQLSARIGFEAKKEITVNYGFYKSDPTVGLCDIHFKASFDVPTLDHNGFDSILPGQIVLYCPCNCGWTIFDGPPDAL